MELPKPVSMPQMAISGPAGTPKRFSMLANSAAFFALWALPREMIVWPPRTCMNLSSEYLKLFWLRSALIVLVEYLALFNALAARLPMPRACAWLPYSWTHSENPAELFPHPAAACAAPAVTRSAVAAAARILPLATNAMKISLKVESLVADSDIRIPFLQGPVANVRIQGPPGKLYDSGGTLNLTFEHERCCRAGLKCQIRSTSAPICHFSTTLSSGTIPDSMLKMSQFCLIQGDFAGLAAPVSARQHLHGSKQLQFTVAE